MYCIQEGVILFHLTLGFVWATACFANIHSRGHCTASHTCIRQQSLIGLSNPTDTKSVLLTLIWERKAYRRLLLSFLLHFELHLPAFISSHNLPDVTALSPVQFEYI